MNENFGEPIVRYNVASKKLPREQTKGIVSSSRLFKEKIAKLKQ